MFVCVCRFSQGYWLWILRDREKFDAQLEGNTWDFANLELGDDGESLGTSMIYGSYGYQAYMGCPLFAQDVYLVISKNGPLKNTEKGKLSCWETLGIGFLTS